MLNQKEIKHNSNEGQIIENKLFLKMVQIISPKVFHKFFKNKIHDHSFNIKWWEDKKCCIVKSGGFVTDHGILIYRPGAETMRRR
jgi:hypothetical protein